ncbi:hypothetical protein ACH4FA_30675 [Streptomyces sp. NPDC017966]|uniref:hypothetical protein n=1 Tax=Streptomyces sp. NPDC017966 TaxID=3365023 RepID=UPI0037BB4BA4
MAAHAHGHGSKGTREYDWAWTVVLALTLAEAMAKAGTPATVAGITLVPLSSPELVRILRDFVLPEQPRDQAYKRWWRTWRRRHQAIQLSASGGC